MIDIAAVVSSAFRTAGANVKGVLRTVTYRRITSQSYDPAAGAVIAATQEFTVRDAVLTGYSRKEKEVDFQNSRRQVVEFGDQKCLIPYASLPVEPAMEDTVLDDAGAVWRIVDHKLDPTGKALHTFQLRRAGDALGSPNSGL